MFDEKLLLPQHEVYTHLLHTSWSRSYAHCVRHKNILFCFDYWILSLLSRNQIFTLCHFQGYSILITQCLAQLEALNDTGKRTTKSITCIFVCVVGPLLCRRWVVASLHILSTNAPFIFLQNGWQTLTSHIVAVEHMHSKHSLI